MKYLPYLAAAALTTASALAANTFYKGASGGDWMTASNWSTGTVPSATDAVLIGSNSSALLADATLGTMNTLNIGAYTTIGLTGTGSLTISNTTATFVNLVTARVSVQNTALTGVDYLYLNNGSQISFSGTANIGYYSETSVQTLTERQSAEIIVDTTSRINAGTMNVGRGTVGTLTLLGGDTIGGTASLGGVVMGSSTGTGVDAGSGRIVMGTHSTLTASSISMGVSSGAYSNSITMNGATLYVGKTLQMNSNSLLSATSSTLTVGGAGVAGSQNMTMSASTLSLNGSTLSVSGTLLANSNSLLSMTNSTLSVTGNTTLSNGALNLSNSSLLIGGRLYSLAGAQGNYLTNSTLSAAAAEFSYTANSITLSNSLISLSSTTAQTQAQAAYSASLSMYNGSRIQIANNGLLGLGKLYMSQDELASTLSMNGGFMAAGTLYAAGGSVINMTNSSISLTSSLSAYSSATATQGISITLTGSTLTAGFLLTSLNTTAITRGATSVLNLTNSTVSVATVATLGQMQLIMHNSTFSAGTSILSQGNFGNIIDSSTISAGSLEFNYATNVTSISNSLITLSSATAITPLKSVYTTPVYLNTNSSLQIGTNGYFGANHLYVGAEGSASLSMTGGALNLSSLLNLGVNADSVGYATLSGGALTASEVMIGRNGTGYLAISGTGVVYARTLSMSGNATLSGNVYVQGTQTTPITAAGQATFDTMNLASGAAFTNGTVHINGTASISLAVSGTPGTYQSVRFNTLAFDGQSILNIDFTDLALTESTVITLLLADTVTGLEYNPVITTSGLAEGFNVAYSQATVGSQTALLASITAIPEPAATAALLGLTAMTTLLIRRRAASRR